MKSLKDFFEAIGFQGNPVFNGELHRFDAAGKNTGWYVVKDLTTKSGKRFLFANGGDWKTGETYSWSNGNDGDPEWEATRTEVQTKAQEDKLKLQQAAAVECSKKWEELRNSAQVVAELNPYLKRKGLTSAPGIVVHADKCYLPCSYDGRVVGLQTINADGSKFFHPGQMVQGTYLVFPENPNTPEFYTVPDITVICEGYATAWAVDQALKGTNHTTLVAWNAGNLLNVAKLARELNSDENHRTKIVICADNDAWTVVRGKPTNVGLNAALECVSQGYADLVIAPEFTDQAKAKAEKLTDWNDLIVTEGLAAVKAQLAVALHRHSAKARVPEDHGPGASEDPVGPTQGVASNVPECTKTPENGENSPKEANLLEKAPNLPENDAKKPEKPAKKGKGRPPKTPDRIFVERLLQLHHAKMLRQDGEIYRYTGTHWQHQTPDMLQAYKNQVFDWLGDEGTHQRTEGVWKAFVGFLSPTPRDINQPNPWLVNFTNGTLHIEMHGSGFTMELKPHAQSDLVTNCLPLPYEENPARNLAFDAMLERIFDGVSDKADRIRAVGQMYGAALAPIFPHLFMLHGPGGSGKSTLMIILQRLIGRENLSHVEPHEFAGFLMESMLHKTVNMVLDIDISKPIEDAQIKKIEDRVPVRIDRKFKLPAHAPLPAIHIFGGNEIPDTLNGVSHAHKRRWTFIKMTRVMTEGETYNKFFVEDLVKDGLSGLLAFALDGLRDLLSSHGHYFQPASGKAKMSEWETQNDPVAFFLDAIKNNEVGQDSGATLTMGENLKIKRSELYRIYRDWYQESGFSTRRKVFSKAGFFNELPKHKLQVSVYAGHRVVKGLGSGIGSDASM